jgi:hypothetical protein
MTNITTIARAKFGTPQAKASPCTSSSLWVRFPAQNGAQVRGGSARDGGWVDGDGDERCNTAAHAPVVAGIGRQFSRYALRLRSGLHSGLRQSGSTLRVRAMRPEEILGLKPRGYQTRATWKRVVWWAWIPGCGFQGVDSRSWIPGSGFQMQVSPLRPSASGRDDRFRIRPSAERKHAARASYETRGDPGAEAQGYQTRATRKRVDWRAWIPGRGFQGVDSRAWVPGRGFQVLDSRCRSLRCGLRPAVERTGLG